MPLLAALLGGAFTKLIDWLVQYFTKKVAFAGAVVVTYSGWTIALLALMRGAQVALDAYVTGVPGQVLAIVGFFIPTAMPFCIGLIVTTWTATTVYAWQREALRLVAQS